MTSHFLTNEENKEQKKEKLYVKRPSFSFSQLLVEVLQSKAGGGSR